MSIEPILPNIEKCAVLCARFKDFKEVPKGVALQPRQFYDPVEEKTKWSTRFYPNGLSSAVENGNSEDGTISLQFLYHGQQKVTARFVVEIIRTEKEYKNEVEPLITKETTRYRFSPKKFQSLKIANFLSHKALYDPKYNFMPTGALVLRVKVLYFYDKEAIAAQEEYDLSTPSTYGNTFIDIIVGNQILKDIPVLPLKKNSKLFAEKLQDPAIKYLQFDHLDPFMVKLIISYILGKKSFFNYIKDNQNDKKMLQEYAEKLQIHGLMMFLTRSDLQNSSISSKSSKSESD